MSLPVLGTLLLLLLTRRVGCMTAEEPEKKICIGTSGRMSVPSNREHHYRNLRDRYTNCTYVDGNLEITWLEHELDLSFLKYIREVTGYVLISQVHIRKIVLPSLQIIRGRSLFKLNSSKEEFSLLVTLCHMYNLEMPVLRDILAGSVGVIDNYNLCHIRSVDWNEIITGFPASFVYYYNFSVPERECPPCDKSCEKGCWGEGAHNCQKFSKVNCSPQCHQGRCFGPRPRDCCHLFCAGGCVGPRQNDCLACRNFSDDGVCKLECPPMQRYNSITYSWEANPDGKYAYGATCVKQCPEHLLKDSGACVKICPEKKKAVNGECVPCNGPCPKTCQGVDIVHAGNIDTFKDCTIIEGSLTFLDHSFSGFQDFDDFRPGARYPSMHPDQLEVFSTLTEITGFLNIQASHPDFRNLSYFRWVSPKVLLNEHRSSSSSRNLEVINGRTKTDYFAALYIVKSSLESLKLNSLRAIRSGIVAILENTNLCFAESIRWEDIVQAQQVEKMLLHNNRPREKCVEEGRVCHPECSEKGCWGSLSDECLSCAHYRLGKTCLQSCDSDSGIYEYGSTECQYCDPECESTCHGPGPGNCTTCAHVRDGPYCVKRCPESKYSSGGGTCLPCHENCINGCSGPANNIGPHGCASCERAILSSDELTVEQCLGKEESCPEGYYNEWMGPQEEGPLKTLASKSICRPCHPRCQNCTGYGFHISVCLKCHRYRRGEQCEEECPADSYPHDDLHECLQCAEECRGCWGPRSDQCLACRNYKIWTTSHDGNRSFQCVASCPDEYPYKIFPTDGIDPYCDSVSHADRDDDRLPAILGSVFGCFALLIVFLLVFGFQWWIRKNKEETIKMMTMTIGFGKNGEAIEPLTVTNIKPNLAQLHIVREAELRKGGILGYGAFGTVYKGVWVPEGKNVKIPVAIKVLREGTGANTSKEILEEAYIMASMEHPNLLRVLAVCMTSQMMLVTQLMPLGCLLDYVRNNREKIGSKPLLNWCTQIARGMAYLEERRLVHRDLAARNVLVQTPNWLKITDFGLAKLLDLNQEEYKAAGGKMPIKWLALECIQHRIFTHKSDVWAFGVTVWEILTYGGRPYENVPAREVPDLLEKGERLPQPGICTIDVYMIMIKCWMVEAESRPGFRELAEEFAKMARDPGRYLVIKGDKLMRLPSYTPQDERELLSRSVPPEGPEVIVDAEQYFQPKSRFVPTDPFSVPDSTAGNRTREGSSSSGRYGPGPLFASDPDTGSDDCFHADPVVSSCRRETRVCGDLQLDLPLDEDDYLVPTPQNNRVSAAYMDLIDEPRVPPCSWQKVDAPSSSSSSTGASRTTTIFRDPRRRHYVLDFVPMGFHQIDNPEYHLVNGALGAGGHHPPPHSEEDSSDHEYYNDPESARRERRPLHRRNETTV